MKRISYLIVIILLLFIVKNNDKSVNAATLTCSGNMTIVCAKGSEAGVEFIMYGDNKIIRPSKLEEQ